MTACRPIPFLRKGAAEALPGGYFLLRKGARDELKDATGTKLPALKLPDGTVITHSRAILAWIAQQPSR